MRLWGVVCCLLLCGGVPAVASCATMQLLAQQHANDLARRDRLDHKGFINRAKLGARAENVAYGCATQACVLARWLRSPGHAANMRLPGCKAVASAVSRSGRRYWVMEIGE
jgi:uncharacterized protein YkwD